MGFDAKKFMRTKFTPREAEVPVPDLRDFFPEGEEPVWKVRGLTGQELGRCNDAAARNKNMAAILEGLAATQAKEKADAVKQLLGVGEVPEDIVKRLEQFVAGSVEPRADMEMALQFCKAFPVEFYQITNKILELTGKGHVPGKPQPSGKTEKSGQA